MLKLGKNYFLKFTHGVPYDSILSDTNLMIHVRECNCELFKDHYKIGEGVAICHLKYDNYNKSIGRKLSFTRALENEGLGRDVRTFLWGEYRKIIK